MWTPTEDEKIGVVICNFRGSVTQGLALEVGETVQILEKCEGWYRGFSTRKPNVKGVFPASYVHLKKAIVTNRGPHETVVPLEDPIVTEVTSTLQEWALLWKQLYVKHKVDLFYKVRHVMMELIDLRRQLLSGHLTQDQSRDVKRHITVRLDWGNEHLGLDLVPRKEFEMVDEDQISVSDLYKMHLSSRHSVQQSTTQGDNTRQRHGEPCRVPVPHHLLVNLKSFTYNSIGEDTDIFFSLYDLREGKTLSEKFMVRLNKNGGPKNPEKVDRLCALFTDLSNKDMKRDLYIISQVIRTGRMLLNDSKKGPPHVQYRRPYGCAVLAMSDVLQTISELKEEKDFVLKVYTCNNENEWYQIHENIIRKSSTKYTAPSTNYGLIISLQLLRGDMEQVRRENPLIFSRGVAITRKLGFPDVIMPGDIRNDLYLTLERGDFERGGKSVQKNIEVTIYVLYADGEILKDCISLGSGEPNVPEHRSFVLYHNNSPRWSEVIKLPIPIDRFRGSHLRFEFRHCSTKDKGEKKLFGFAFTPLMREDGTTLSDESHELYVYKFLQDILDTLFSILDDNTDKYGPLVFQSLVFIINLLRDSKYYHFRSVMDTYIQKHFAGALAYKFHLSQVINIRDKRGNTALEYLFKFIIQSRILYSRATCGMEEEQFRTSVQELFQSIRFVLSLDSRNSETLIFTQAALLNSFPAIFDELLQMFTVQEVAEFVRGTLGSMPSTVHIGQSMDVVKLQSIARTVDSRLFSFPESRRILLPVVLHHIHLHLRQQKELLICSGILSSIFSIIKTSSLDTSVQEEVEMMVESLLDVLLQTLLSIMSKSQSQEAVRGQRCPQCTAEIAGEYVSCLLSLLRQMTDIHFQHLMENFQSKDELKNFYKSEINKEEMYIRYIHKLCDMHLQAENYTEAAFTLLLYWELLHWDERPLKEFLHYPAQTEWHRKEGLCRKVIHYFNKGKLLHWDERPLKEFLHYPAQTEWHRKEGLCRKVIHYFNKGKCYIKPPEVWTVCLPACRVFQSLWIERTTLILTHPLPGISRWFEVEKRELVEVSPLENAISVVENKNQELRTLISQYQHKQLHGNINLLSMTLNGVIDAAVNGGIARYQEAFFDKEYITSHPEDTEKITQLKDLMQEQVHILGVGLAVHEKLVHPEMRPLHKKLIDQFQMMRSSLCHGLPGLDKSGSGPNTPRGILATHGPMSPESFKLMHRHSPVAVLTPVRNSSSSLSSHNSSEMGNVGNLLILADGMVVEHPEDFYRMQASLSSSSLSSTHSAPSQMINSAPSTIRVGSPSLPDKYRHNREMLMLLPPHRERPSSAMYTNITDNGQPPNFQRALFHQVIGPCKPCSDPNLSVAEKGQHLSMHFDAFHHQVSDLPPALPARSLRKSPLHPIPASPTSPQSILDGSNSNLSGSASSGVSSLSESNFGGPASSSDPTASRTDTLESVPSSQAWTTDQEDLDSPYQPVRYSVSEPEVLDGVKPPPCRSHSAPGGVTPAQVGSQIQPQAPGSTSIGVQQMQQQDVPPHPQHPHYYHQLHHHFHPHYIPHHPPLYHFHEPPALPPKPYLREGCIPEEDSLISQSAAPPPPAPRPMPRKISQPIIAATKDEQAKVAWEHGIGEE
ncbi:dedicator of cytokinesis protein 3-like [Pundamilia nyererei]|uniref:Dedicator of cytokinesis protein 3-like n=1 Tax=Pundamilia nyererei TaxID=303518 RepID=A0A9Y6JEN6_9CICH|nr:PREDICTED: dedicator of cytokinesis protein 3-like [Pundamilia nyererei]